MLKFSAVYMRSPVNKSYILDILRVFSRPKVAGMVLGVAVGFFYKPWVIFSQRKNSKLFRFFFALFGLVEVFSGRFWTIW